jgi:phage gpG-like protein
MQYFIEAMGIRQVQTKFSRVGLASQDAAPAFRSIAALLFAIEEQIFNSQGRRGGGSWRNLTAEWMLYKIRNRLDPRIGHATHALRESVTELNAPGQILLIGRKSLVFGSDLPYAATQQRNRPFIKYTLNDKARMRNILRDYLVAAWRTAR